VKLSCKKKKKRLHWVRGIIDHRSLGCYGKEIQLVQGKGAGRKGKLTSQDLIIHRITKSHGKRIF